MNRRNISAWFASLISVAAFALGYGLAIGCCAGPSQEIIVLFYTLFGLGPWYLAFWLVAGLLLLTRAGNGAPA